jgi:hypothetical protein
LNNSDEVPDTNIIDIIVDRSTILFKKKVIRLCVLAELETAPPAQIKLLPGTILGERRTEA